MTITVTYDHRGHIRKVSLNFNELAIAPGGPDNRVAT